MVKVKPTASQGRITVRSNNDTTIFGIKDNLSEYYAKLSERWANSPDMVNGIDYSSKYYAEKSKESANKAEIYKNNTLEAIDGFEENMQVAKNDIEQNRINSINAINNTCSIVMGDMQEKSNEVLTLIESSKAEAVDSINTTKTTILNDIEFVADGEKEEIQDLADEIKDNGDAINTAINAGVERLNSIDVLKKSQITNCLLDVPQRIKYTLENGTLTIKAGTQVIVPNGFEADGVTPKFEYYTLETDRVEDTDFGYDSKHILCYMPSTSDFYNPQIELCFSGNTAPTIYQYMLWYDTTNNKIKWSGDYGASWTGYPISLPILTGYLSAIKVWTSIDQVFNGIGYIGSTVWVDKGVKGLIPNGRNEDGTLKNIEFTLPNLITTTLTGSKRDMVAIVYNDGTSYSLYRGVYKDYKYDAEANVNMNIQTHPKWDILPIARTEGDITSFQPKQPFRAVDYSDKSEIVSWGMPDYSAGVSVTSLPYTAINTGYIYIEQQNDARITVNNVNVAFNFQHVSVSNSQNIGFLLPVCKNDTISSTITDRATNIIFYPLKGAK